MGREIRRVPLHWEHPRNPEGCPLPLYDETFEVAALRWKLAFFQWESGTHPEQQQDMEFWEWEGDPPDRDYYRQEWSVEPTAYLIYETVSEGTPVSPVFATLDDLRDWCRQRGHNETVIERFIKNAWAPSAVLGPETGQIRMGIDALQDLAETG